MIKNFLSLFLMLSLIIFFLGCEKDNDYDAVNIINNDMLIALQGGPRAPQCTELKADIPTGGKVEGPICTDNKAVINGWSLKCVQNCDNAERLRELNAEAKQFCSNWCDGKGCSYTYSALSQCNTSYCFTTNFCTQNCNGPFRDQCYFQQGLSDYNCECKIHTPPPERKIEADY